VPGEWNQESFAAVVAGWSSTRPTVFISYDHPRERLPTTDQIKRAEDMLPTGDNAFREILFKPEGADDDEVNVQAIVANVHKLAGVDAMGVTEKEIGATLQTRMASIATLRRALDGAGLDGMPIHIFGSLDTNLHAFVFRCRCRHLRRTSSRRSSTPFRICRKCSSKMLSVFSLILSV
jgi:hypothetical protein